MSNLQISDYKNSEFDILLSMAQKLFPGYALENLTRDLKFMTEKDSHHTFFAKHEEDYIGFSVVSIRSDYVEGATTSPTGYLEAIYVEEDFRKSGIARTLYEAGEKWVAGKGCSEMGSDTWLTNENAQNFHLKLGFEEDDRLVHYIKKINL